MSNPSQSGMRARASRLRAASTCDTEAACSLKTAITPFTDVVPPENDSALVDPKLFLELRVFDKTKLHDTAKVDCFSLGLCLGLYFMLFTHCSPAPASYGVELVELFVGLLLGFWNATQIRQLDWSVGHSPKVF